MGVATRDSVPCCAGQFGKSFAFSIQSLSPLSYMGLNVDCIVQRFLHDDAIPDYGAFPRCCWRVVLSPLTAAKPMCPRTTLWF